MKKAVSEQTKIEAGNLLEQAREALETCISCGLCKGLCPVFKILREEDSSPRGHAILLSNRILEKSVFKCTMCRACEARCPLNLKICDAILAAREALVLKNRGLKQNTEMIERLHTTGSPYEGV